MSSTFLTPYLYFNDNCREAMTFYQGIFGGNLSVMTYGEGGADLPPEYGHLVMHASIMDGPVELMASDDAGTAAKGAGNTHLTLHGYDAETLRDWFGKLSAGATKVQPLKSEVWGDTYGELTDQYGIHWLFNIGSGQG